MDSYVSPIDGCSSVCPALIQGALELISPKWAVPVLMSLRLADRPLRYAEIERQLSGISPKELARHLRAFEAAGLVIRTVHPTVPPAVDYAMTPLGARLMHPLEEMAKWRLDAATAAPQAGSDDEPGLKPASEGTARA